MTGQTTPVDSSTVIRGVLHLLSRSMVARVTGFLSSIVLARLLAPEEFGKAAVAMSIVNIAVFFLDSGLTAAALRSSEEPSIGLLRALSGVQLAITMVAVAIIVPIAFLGDNTALTITSLALLPLMSLQTPLFIVAERRLEFRHVSNAELAANLGSQALTIALVFVGLGVWALVIGTVARPLFSGAWMAPRADRRVLVPSWHISPAIPLLRDAMRLQVMPASIVLRDQGSVLIAATAVGASTLGVWVLVGRLLSIPAAVYAVLGRVAYPTMAAKSREGGIDPEQLRRAMRRIAFASAWLLGLASAGSIYAVPLVFGDTWRSAVPALLATCPGLLVITAVATPSASLMMLERRVGWPTVGVALHAAVAWAVLVMHPWGESALTIGIATTLGSLVEAAVLLQLLHKRGVAWPSSLVAVGPPLVFATAAVVAGYTIGIPFNPVVAAVLAPVTAGAVLGVSSRYFLGEEWNFARLHLTRRRAPAPPQDTASEVPA